MRRREFLGLVGSVAGWPVAARAQDKDRVQRIGVLRFNPRHGKETFAEPFRQYMQAVGWEERRNVHYDFVWADGLIDQLPILAAELVARNVDLIVAFGDLGIRAAQRATPSIPIVGLTDDLVGSGLAASLARPGGNTTGVSILASELDVKRLEVLCEFVPKAKRIAILIDPTTISTRPQLEQAAHRLSVEIVPFEAQSSEQIAGALDAMEGGLDAVNVLASPILNNSRSMIIDRLRQARLPAIYQWPECAEEGGLLAYGPRNLLAYRHVVSLVDKILRGRRPVDLPIEQPSKLELVVNLKTATAIGLTISSSLLLRADQVIE
jgi:putative tryptophan/tyrosine transport system substrate-binding protein